MNTSCEVTKNHFADSAPGGANRKKSSIEEPAELSISPTRRHSEVAPEQPDSFCNFRTPGDDTGFCKSECRQIREDMLSNASARAFGSD